MGTDHARCPGGACPVCYPPSSVVGSDGRAEDKHAATVGPPKAAPAPEDEKPGESASQLLIVDDDCSLSWEDIARIERRAK